MHTITKFAASLALVALVLPQTAKAQWSSIIADVIGQTIMNSSGGANTCMIGGNVGAKEIAEARDPAPGIMQGYFAAAGAQGSQKSRWFKLNKRTRWQTGSVIAGMATLDTAVDPLAVAGNRLDPMPLRFYRSGNYSTALGQWAVLDANQQIAGVYTAMFDRDRGVWKLRELTISLRDEIVAPIAQYCASPGDVTAYRVSSSENWVKYARDRVAKAEAKLAEGEVKLGLAEARLAEKPKDTSRLESARSARAAVEKRRKDLAARQQDLINAIADQEAAASEAADITALTAPASQAYAFRIVDSPTKVNGTPGVPAGVTQDRSDKAEKQQD